MAMWVSEGQKDARRCSTFSFFFLGFFLELQKKFFLLSGQALIPPPLLLMTEPLKKEIFSDSLRQCQTEIFLFQLKQCCYGKKNRHCSLTFIIWQNIPLHFPPLILLGWTLVYSSVMTLESSFSRQLIWNNIRIIFLGYSVPVTVDLIYIFC